MYLWDCRCTDLQERGVPQSQSKTFKQPYPLTSSMGELCERMCVCLAAQSRATPCNPMDCKPTKLLCPWDFPGKNTGLGCHFPSLGDLPNPGIEPMAPVSPALQADSLPAKLSGKNTKF